MKFKKLPFYKVLYELLQPSNLIPKGPLIQQRNSFIFYLTHQQVAAIILSRDLKPEEESVQGQLRFCLLETSSTQEDTFPAGLNVRVNDKFCNIQVNFVHYFTMSTVIYKTENLTLLLKIFFCFSFFSYCKIKFYVKLVGKVTVTLKLIILNYHILCLNVKDLSQKCCNPKYCSVLPILTIFLACLSYLF